MRDLSKILYFSDRWVVMLNFQQCLFGVSFDPFGGIIISLLILVVKLRTDGPNKPKKGKKVAVIA